MNARDLLTALNDIDSKLLEDTLPWGAPVQRSRRPVWAVAAAIVLCVGLVGGVVLSQNYVPQLANDATAPTQGLTELQYAQGNTEELDRLGAMCCMECGTCAYNCPAGRPLVQAIRMGKALLRNGGKK